MMALMREIQQPRLDALRKEPAKRGDHLRRDRRDGGHRRNNLEVDHFLGRSTDNVVLSDADPADSLPQDFDPAEIVAVDFQRCASIDDWSDLHSTLPVDSVFVAKTLYVGNAAQANYKCASNSYVSCVYDSLVGSAHGPLAITSDSKRGCSGCHSRGAS